MPLSTSNLSAQKKNVARKKKSNDKFQNCFGINNDGINNIKKVKYTYVQSFM